MDTAGSDSFAAFGGETVEFERRFEPEDAGGDAIGTVAVTAAAVSVGSESDRRGESPDTGGGDETDIEALLRSLGIATATAAGGLCLDPEFRTAWRDRIVDIRDRKAHRQELAAQLDSDLDPGRLSLEVAADGFVATHDRTRVGRWPSNAALLADLGAVDVLAAGSEWCVLDGTERGTVLAALRLFLERCPNCDGAIVGIDGTDAESVDETGDTGSGEDVAGSGENESERSLLVTTPEGRTVECDHCGVVLFRDSPTD